MFVALWLLPFMDKFFIEVRNRAGKKKTEKENLKEEFIKKGGIVGYKPVNNKHTAVIFINESGDNYADVNFDFIEPIINYCKKNNEDYKVYFCYLSNDFIKIVRSEYTHKIHIIGHGRMSILRFEDGYFSYRELQDVEPKELVAQWHCNHNDKEEFSLGYLIGKEYHAPYGLTFIPFTKRNIDRLINGKTKPKKNSKFQ